MQQVVAQKVSGINGNEFEFNIENKQVSSLSPGYIIRPDGVVIKVLNTEDHDDVFNRYLNSFLENDTPVNYNIAKSISLLLNEYGHIIYYGVKTCDSMDIYSHQGNTNGYAFFFVPDNYDIITEEQINIISDIISSNYSLISNHEILPLKYQSITSFQPEPIDELLNKINKIKRR